MAEPEYGIIPQEQHKGGKRAIVLSADRFEDFELTELINRLV